MPGCYIIDDENHAVELLSSYISQTPGLDLLGSSLDPVAGLHQVLSLQPNLLFLDIDMPKLSGIDLYRVVTGSTAVVFTTAHANYAVDAFSLNAADFLLKPIRYTRFLNCIDKLAVKMQVKEFIFLQSNAKGKMSRIRLGDILYIESLNNFVHIHLQGESHTVYIPLKEVAEQLPAELFCRIHKSFIINYQQVKAVEGNRVFLPGAKALTELAIGPQYREAFFQKVRLEQLRKK